MNVTLKETRQLVSTAGLQQSQLLDETNNAIDEQLNTTCLIQDDAQKTLAALEQEIMRLEHAREQTDREINAKTAPIARANEWLTIRGMRPTDMNVNDEVERCLRKLLATLRESVAKLTTFKEKETAKLQVLNNCHAALTADIADKHQAVEVDHK